MYNLSLTFSIKYFYCHTQCFSQNENVSTAKKTKENFSELKSFLFSLKLLFTFQLLFKILPSTCSVCNWRKFIEWHSIYIGGEFSSLRMRCMFLLQLVGAFTLWRIVGFLSMREAFEIKLHLRHEAIFFMFFYLIKALALRVLWSNSLSSSVKKMQFDSMNKDVRLFLVLIQFYKKINADFCLWKVDVWVYCFNVTLQ